jgi:mono/diheme cytochrome c family protein
MSVKSLRPDLIRVLSASVLAILSGACFAATSSGAADGKQLFDSNCAVCHKLDGSGGIKLGTVTSADLRAPGLEQSYHTDALLRRAILDGKDESDQPLDPVMPHWRGHLTRPEVTAIIEYLKTLH